MIYLLSVTFSKQILRITTEIYVRDAENETGKWCSVLVSVSVCLLTARPIPERHFYFRAVGRGFRMYEDTKWHNVISKLNNLWVDIPILHFDSL